MSRFTTIPGIPSEGLSEYQTILLAAVKQNMELLIGTRGEDDLQSMAITKGDITVEPRSLQNMRQVSAKGAGFTISGQDS